MKNKSLLFIISGVIIVAGIVLFVMFSPKKLTCTSKSDQSKNGYVLESKYVIYPAGKNVSKVEVTQTITSKDEEVLKNFETQFKEDYEYFKKNYGGYEYKISNNNDKLSSKITINYKKLDMKKFIENNSAMKQYTKNNKLTMDGAKKMYEASGATCK